MTEWVGVVIAMAPAMVVLALALWTLTPWQQVWENSAALEVLQESTVHAAFYGPAATVAVVSIFLSKEEADAWRTVLHAGGGLLLFSSLWFAYLCSRRRHQLEVLEHVER
jgi:hypothetical protein